MPYFMGMHVLLDTSVPIYVVLASTGRLWSTDRCRHAKTARKTEGVSRGWPAVMSPRHPGCIFDLVNAIDVKSGVRPGSSNPSGLD
jgi:hypothetical protein